jgi:hypothetical protein
MDSVHTRIIFFSTYSARAKIDDRLEFLVVPFYSKENKTIIQAIHKFIATRFFTFSVSISVSTRACHAMVRAKAGFDSQTESGED